MARGPPGAGAGLIERVTVKGTAKEKPAEGGDAEIASSVRKRFGLADTASKSEVLLRLSLVDVDGERRRDAETRLAALTDADTDRQAKTLVDKHVQANRINPRDQEQYAAALVFAKEDPARFEQIMGATKPLVPAGRTTAPDQAVGQRGTIVAKASREFDDNIQIQKLTDKQSHVSLALRDAGLSKLSTEESERLIAG